MYGIRVLFCTLSTVVLVNSEEYEVVEYTITSRATYIDFPSSRYEVVYEIDPCGSKESTVEIGVMGSSGSTYKAKVFIGSLMAGINYKGDMAKVNLPDGVVLNCKNTFVKFKFGWGQRAVTLWMLQPSGWLKLVSKEWPPIAVTRIGFKRSLDMTCGFRINWPVHTGRPWRTTCVSLF